MPIVESLSFQDWNEQTKTVKFVDPSTPWKRRPFATTVVTGQNGSHKSTMLRALVSALTLPSEGKGLQLRGGHAGPSHVICCSGSVADRFPDKERVGGGATEFSVPNYAYLGQRVGRNLLSKKRPLETMLTYALDSNLLPRFDSEFFRKAHALAGVETTTEYDLRVVPPKFQGRDLFGEVEQLSKLLAYEKGEKPHRQQLSGAMAKWLLEEFNKETFRELEGVILNAKRLKVTFSLSGPRPERISSDALRLGLLLDVVSLTHAEVVSARTKTRYSAYDLSSGEYHMLTSLLALGFGVQSNSVVLIDEPENSLHPQWQREFMDAVSKICGNWVNDGHLIVCTHSPLIVAAAPQGSAVVDLAADESLVNQVSYGASSDELLLSQFGVGSSRNRIVVDIVQKAVALVERGGFESRDFIELTPELRSVRNALRDEDPLSYVIDSLLGDEVRPT